MPRTFILNNRSLETLSLDYFWCRGELDGPPTILSNLKLLDVYYPQDILLTIFHTPALQRLSSLSILPEKPDYDRFTFRATGEGIVFTLRVDLYDFVDLWQDLTKHAKPTIRHVRLENPDDRELVESDGCNAVFSLLTDVHTLEIGRGYAPNFYPDFWEDLKQFLPQLRTIRFEIPEETEPHPYPPSEYQAWGAELLHGIEELVTYRFQQGRPFSVVERMVVSESEPINRQQDFVWRSFYSDRRLDQYIGHE